MNVRGAAPTYCSDLVGWSRRGPRAGRRHIRVPQELGRSRRLFLDKFPDGDTGSSTPGPTLPHSCSIGSEIRVPGRYRQTKDNEVRRNGRREVGAPRSTCEAGEQLSPGPCGGKGVPGHRPVARKPVEGFVPRESVNATTTDSVAKGESVI